MENIIISTAAQVSYKYNGLFESSSPDWIHMSRTLKEYQLIIVTEGTLHIADSEKDYTVNQNEYLNYETRTSIWNGTLPLFFLLASF